MAKRSDESNDELVEALPRQREEGRHECMKVGLRYRQIEVWTANSKRKEANRGFGNDVDIIFPDIGRLLPQG